MSAEAEKRNIPPANCIAYYSLDYLQMGEKQLFLWHYLPAFEEDDSIISLLVNLGNVLLPPLEIDKLISRLERQMMTIHSIAFLNCHISNQREVKRRLKAYDIRLYSKSAFFSDAAQARQWLSTRQVNC